MKPKVYNAFGKVPNSIPPSQPVRRVDHGVALFLVLFLTLYPGLTWFAWQLPDSPLTPRLSFDLVGAPAAIINKLSFGALFPAKAHEYLSFLWEPWKVWIRVGSALAVSLGVASWVGALALKPSSNTWHVKGPRLLEGREAVHDAHRRSMTPRQVQDDVNRMSLKLHPELHLPKSHWSRHTLLQGSVGSGKTQILLPIIDQIIKADHKLFLFDTKGDFTSYFTKPIIVCPFDQRSYYWDIAADCRYPLQAAILAEILIAGSPDQKNGDFWTTAARQLLVGAIRSLQAEKPLQWTWADLAERKNRNAVSMLPMIQEHFATATSLIENTESQTTASLLSTLVAQTKMIDDLAMAWPVRKENRRFAITEWAEDGYKGRKQVIVQSGPEEAMTKAYISALVNIAVPEIISPKLPDAEKDRFIGFVFDELATAGKLNIGPLIDKGRSKGVVFIGAFQDIAQIKATYGEDFQKSLASMVGTHVICQLQMGETREKAAQQLGKHRVAFRTHDEKATVNEESRALVSPGELTDRLGPRKGKHYGPHGFGVRAIVQMGGDPLLLDFPGVVMKFKRPGQVQARWMTQPHQRRALRTDLPTHYSGSPKALEAPKPKHIGMSRDEIEKFFKD